MSHFLTLFLLLNHVNIFDRDDTYLVSEKYRPALTVAKACEPGVTKLMVMKEVVEFMERIMK